MNGKGVPVIRIAWDEAHMDTLSLNGAGVPAAGRRNPSRAEAEGGYAAVNRLTLIQLDFINSARKEGESYHVVQSAGQPEKGRLSSGLLPGRL